MSPRSPDDRRTEGDLTFDDVFMLVVALATFLGLMALIGFGSLPPSSRLDAVIARLAS